MFYVMPCNFGSLKFVWASIGIKGQEVYTLRQQLFITTSLFLTGASLRDVVAGFLNVNNSNMPWPQSDLGLSLSNPRIGVMEDHLAASHMVLCFRS
jgi:hypothetical protein